MGPSKWLVVLTVGFAACSSSGEISSIGSSTGDPPAAATSSAAGTTGGSSSSAGATGTAAGGSSTGARTTAGTSSAASSTGTSTGTSSGGGSSTGAATSGSTTGSASTAQVWLWLFFDYANGLDTLKNNAASFTHISPALYMMNYDYQGGVPSFSSNGGRTNQNGGPDLFDGLTSTQIATAIHAMGLKVVPLIYGGAANSGTDDGIKNVLNDLPVGTQASFITSLVAEAQAKGYDGWNLDWEASLQDVPYGPLLNTFLTAAHTAFAAAGLSLTIDILDSAIVETWCSGGSGFIELNNIGPAVDGIVVEAYQSSLGTPSTGCPASLPNPVSCFETVDSDLALFCTYLPPGKAIIGLDAAPGGTNAIAGEAFAAIAAYGFDKVAIWPDYNTDGPKGSYLLMDPGGLDPPDAGGWYGLLQDFLSANQ